MRKLLLHTIAVLLLPLPGAAQSWDDTTLRLSTVARVWGTVKYAHPYLGYRDIDWDAAGVRAADRARGSDPLPEVIDEMLAELRDPVTRVAPACVALPRVIPAESRYEVVAEGTILLPLATLSDSTMDPALSDAIRTARHLIFDLRTPVESCSTPPLLLLRQIEERVVRDPLALPGQRKVLHRGYRSHDLEFDPGYWSDFVVEPGPTISGSDSANQATATFLVDERTALPPFAVAMVLAGRGRVVSAGPFDERSAVDTIAVPIDDSATAIVRTSELVNGNNGWTLAAAATLPASSSRQSMIAAALGTAAPGRRRAAALPARPLPDYVWKQDEPYPSMEYPAFEYRALAAFRLWNVINHFYAYLHLIGDWEARLPEVIHLLTTAASQREYDLALARAMTFVPDGHSGVYSPSFMALRGPVAPPFFLMPVEGKPVVVEIIDAAAAGPVVPGDELVAVDGRAVAERRAELEPYISASTDAAREFYVTASLPRAATVSTSTFTFRKPDGTEYTAELERRAYTRTPPDRAWRILPGNIGYADLEWLESHDVPRMFVELAGTRGLILDIRNYPRGVFFVLAAYLNTSGASARTSQIRVPRLIGGLKVWEEFVQDLGRPSDSPKYTAPVVALIDERAQSQSEHTCLVIEAINGTTRFVGSPSVGANGNVTFMVMPGEIYIMFGGMDVRHLDGRQLQRVGVLPDVEVPRTIDAFRSGRDELLDRAVEMLSQ